MNILEKIKTSPWGLNIIVLIFGIEMIRSLVELFRQPELYKFTNSIVAILLFIGFLLRWETARFIWRLFSGAFFFIIVYYVLLGHQFDFKQKILATVSLCISGVIFFYLGRPAIRELFKKSEISEKQAGKNINDEQNSDAV